MFNFLQKIFNRKSRDLDYSISEYLSDIENKNGKVLYEKVLKFNESGFLLLENLVPVSDVSQTLEDFNTFLISNEREASKFRDENGLHSRLCNFHLVSRAARKLLSDPLLNNLFKSIFNDDPVIYSSLFFEKGSQQRIHRDVPFFFTKPRNMFVGVWIALEDIAENTGELIYYPEGHTLNLSKTDRSYLNWDNYCASVSDALELSGIRPVKGLVKKGDVIIWHPELPHGGSEIKDKRASRKSIVFHIVAKNSTIYGEKDFFNNSRFKLTKSRKYPIIKDEIYEYVNHIKPEFAENNY